MYGLNFRLFIYLFIEVKLVYNIFVLGVHNNLILVYYKMITTMSPVTTCHHTPTP